MTVFFDPEKHAYSDGDGISYPSVTYILAESGLCDFSFVEEEVRLRAMARGRSVHWMLQCEDQGVLDYRTVPKVLKPYRKQYCEWKKRSGFVPEQIEQPFISIHGFAGTPDRIGAFPSTPLYPRGSRAVVDFKIGGICEWVKYQLVLYAVGTTKHIWQAKMLRRIALSIKPEGTLVKEFPLSTWDGDFATAMQAKKEIQCR
jgi:hypothetical protein